MIDASILLEPIAVVLGILSVYLTVKQNLWCWPTGIAMTILYVIIFFNAKLYSDTFENAVYIVLQIYGWYFWVYGGKKKNELQVTRLSNKKRKHWMLGIIIISVIAGYLIDNYTDAELAYADALTTVMSLSAQWLMSKKKIENWFLWINVDVMALFIYTIKGLYMTTGLYAVFLWLAVAGLLSWKKSKKA